MLVKYKKLGWIEAIAPLADFTSPSTYVFIGTYICFFPYLFWYNFLS